MCKICSWTPGAGGGKKGGCWFKVRQASQDLLFILLFAILLTGEWQCVFQHDCKHCAGTSGLRVMMHHPLAVFALHMVLLSIRQHTVSPCHMLV